MDESHRPLTILHTAGHPADAFDLAGGTLCHHIRRGDRVVVLVFTHGTRSHSFQTIEDERFRGKDVSIGKAVDQKQREVVEACQLLEIEDVRFLRHEDDLLLPTRENVMAVAKLVREVRPDIVTTHSPFEPVGTTHRTCAQITQQAVGAAAGLIDDANPPHRVGEIFYVWCHGDTQIQDFASPRFPAIIVDITDVAEQKLKAIQKIQSQYYGGKFAVKMMEGTNGIHGLHRCVPYSETFVPAYPHVCDYLPVSQHNLRYASEPLEETYQRMGKMLGDGG
ncbi:PIG-L family deacetylase [Pirellulales bacterium]|nr:PIG-L family deacetylase [Pirellulales bacterium]